jgi:ABC-type sulfate transport system permease component
MVDGALIITIVYALIGATGALSVVVFVAGFSQYITKIGLPSAMRDPGVSGMEWSIRLILTAIVLIVVLRYLESWLA